MCVFKRISNSLSSSNSVVLVTFGFHSHIRHSFFLRLFCSSYLLDYFTVFFSIMVLFSAGLFTVVCQGFPRLPVGST